MKNKTALITGASSGIGKELAIVHAKNGGNLVIVARRKDELEQLKKELEENYKISVYVIVKDLTLINAPEEIYAEIKENNVIVDYLINNAGFGGRGFFHERDLKQELDMIQVNIIALTKLTHLFLPDFVKMNSGKILNVSSTAALMPGPLQAVYYATKAYVSSLSNALTEELRNTNVTVTALLPGATDTGFSKMANMEKTNLFKNTTSPKIVAEEGYAGMLKGKIDVISGLSTTQKMMFSMLKFMPKKPMLKQIFDMQTEN